jgi:hypothetical protein
MKLTDKGPVIPPPVLSGWAQQVSLDIQSWPAIVSATHWQFSDPTVVDGADFYVAESELGHIHLGGEIHVVLTKVLRNAVIAAGFARPFRWNASFVQCPIDDEASAHHALWIFHLAYDQIQGAGESDLLDKIVEAASDVKRRVAPAY